MKAKVIAYWAATGLISGFMLFSAFMYFSKSPEVVDGFKAIGFPAFFATLLGTAKLLGAIALIQPKWKTLQEWAYAGFTFVFISATWTHIATSTPFSGPVIALCILGISYWFRRKLVSSQI